MVDAGLPLAGGGSFSGFRDFYRGIFLHDHFSERPFLRFGVHPCFFRGHANQRIACGERGGLAVGALSQCRDDAVRMGLGHVPGGAAGSFAFLGDRGAGGFAAARKELVRLRAAMGIYPDDQSIAGSPAALSAGMGGISWRALVKPRDLEAGAGRGDRDSLLRAMDSAKLRGVSQVRSAAFEFSVGTLYR
jgi:hypothetical protein